ncbi:MULTISPECIES: sugar 3,4-ketoisomerase [Falsihalocynthiibacter]
MIISDISKPCLLSLPNFSDARGQLGVVESGALPFEIKRFYYLFDVPLGAQRGEHGHKQLQQVMICLHGSCTVTLNDSKSTTEYKLTSPDVGLYVARGLWRSLSFDAPGTVVGVLASRPFETDDYLYTFEDFLAWKQLQNPVK